MAYPNTVTSFTTKTSGQTIDESHVNDLQVEVNAVEDGLLNGIRHDLTPSTNSTRALGSATKRWRLIHGTSIACDRLNSTSLEVTGKSTIVNLTATNSTITNLTATNSTITNQTVSKSTVADLTATNSTITNLTATNSTVTNLTATNSTVTNLTATNSTVTNLTATNSTITNLTATNSTVTNLTATNSTITNLQVTNSTFSVKPLFPPPALVRVQVAANLNLANGTTLAVDWLQQVIAINSSMHSSGANPERITPQSTGVYEVIANIHFNGAMIAATNTVSAEILDSTGNLIAVAKGFEQNSEAALTLVGLKHFNSVSGSTQWARVVARCSDSSTHSISTQATFSMHKL